MIKVYYTNHPAALMRSPDKLNAVEAHLRLMCNHVEGRVGFLVTPKVPSVALSVPDYRISELSLDIETYGIIRSLPSQRYFHPVKCVQYDGIPRHALVQTCGLSWRNPQGDLQSTILVMRRESHRKLLWQYLRKLRAEYGTLLGQNIQFDLTMLRFAYPECRPILDHRLRIADLAVYNYLHYESRPERSLKTVTPLFQVTEYDTKDEKGEYKRYESDEDPELWTYNCQDTEATLVQKEKFVEEIEAAYPDTSKLTEYTKQWYSDLLWLVIWMTEAGVSISESGVRELEVRYKARQKRLMDYASCKWKFERVQRKKRRKAGEEWIEEVRFEVPATLQGEGSDAWKAAVMDEAGEELARLGLHLNVALELTKKKKEVSINDANRNAYLEVLPSHEEVSKKLRTIARYETVSKLIDSYVEPLLQGRKAKVREPLAPKIIDGRVYPRWFPVPGAHDGGEEGGAKVRFAAKGPSVPTFPPPLKARLNSRFDYLLWADLSQIEIVIAALLSNDRTWMEELRKSNPDVHRDMAIIMFGPDIVNHPQYKALYRQGAKTYNFRMIYRGGDKKAQDTLMKDLGLFLSLQKIREIDAAFWRAHPDLWNWHEELVKLAGKQGYLDLPLIGQSRSFPGGLKVAREQINEIVNTPVQGVASCVMQSAQYHLWREFRDRGMKAVVPVNIYDALSVEFPAAERATVYRLVAETLSDPPYYRDLCRLLGRRLPLRFETSEYDCRGSNCKKTE